MKTKKKKNTHFFIWILCLGIFSSILILFLVRKPQGSSFPTQNGISLITSPEIKAVFNFYPTSLNLKPGGQTEIEFAILFPKQVTLDGINVILSYDPSLITVQKITPQKVFSFSSITPDPVSGQISATFLEEKGDGVKLSGQIKLMKISLRAKAPGTSEISVVEAEKGPTSVITQTATSKKLDFEAIKLILLTE